MCYFYDTDKYLTISYINCIKEIFMGCYYLYEVKLFFSQKSLGYKQIYLHQSEIPTFTLFKSELWIGDR